MVEGVGSVQPINTKRDVALTYLTRLVLLAAKFATGVLVARLLGVEGKGLFILAFYLPQLLATLTDLSVGQALIYRLRRHQIQTRELLFSTAVPALITSIPVVLVYLWGLPWLRANVLKGLDEDLASLTILAFPALIMLTYSRQVLRALGRIPWFNAFTMLREGAPFVALAIGLFVFEATPRVAVYANFGTIVALGAFALLMVGVISFPPRAIGAQSMAQTYVLGAKFHFVSLLARLEYRLDILLLAFFLDPADVALYSVGVAVAQLPWSLSNSVGVVLFPKVVSLKEEAAAAYACVMSRCTLLLNALTVAGLLVIAYPLISLAYGVGFTPAYRAFAVLAPGIVIHSLFRVLSGYFSGIGRPLVTARVSALTLMTNIALNLWLIPNFGFLGAALASTLTYSLGGILLLSRFVAHTGRPFTDAMIVQKVDWQRVESYYRRLAGRVGRSQKR